MPLVSVVVFVTGLQKDSVLLAIGREVPAVIGVEISSMSGIVFEYFKICYFLMSEGCS